MQKRLLTCMCMPLGHVHAIVTYVVHVSMRICSSTQSAVHAHVCSSTVHNLLNIYGFQAEPKGYRSGRRKKSSQYTHHPEPHGRDHGRLHFITQAKFNSGRSLQGQETPPSTCARTEELESVRQEVQATRQVSEATKQLVQRP